MLSPNTILRERYRIIHQLGHGGMGAVYQAMDENLSCVVAVKETFATSDEQRRAFRREAELLANLSHAALPRVMDHFTHGEGQFLVMQFVPGHDLAELLELREQPFPVAKVLDWADQLLDALEELHSSVPPIVHRDIKPSNLKVTPKGKVLLLDFGLAKGFAGQMSTADADSRGKSIYGYTAHYAPLEQMRGAGTDQRSDLYSLAATLWTLLTGKIPPDALSRVGEKEDGNPDPLIPAYEINPQVPLSVSDQLKRAMSLNRNQRQDTATELRKALGHAQEEVSEHATLPLPGAGPPEPTSLPPGSPPPGPTIKAPEPASHDSAPVNQHVPTMHVDSPPAVPSWDSASASSTANSFVVEGEKSRQRWKPVLLIVAGAVVLAIVVAFQSGWRPWASEQQANGPTKTNQQATDPMPHTRTNQTGIEFVLIPPGSFMMGSASSDSEKPVHQVTINHSFDMSKYEVTQTQWQAVMGNNPSKHQDCGGDCPVESVSWDDAQKFIQRLNRMNDGYIYRLPTESEWEYACRAGTTGDYAGNLDAMAWFYENAGDAQLSGEWSYDKLKANNNRMHPVGQKQPNAFGLYDMHGNVWEWCQDWYHESYIGAPTDGSAWLTGGEQKYRVVRGGSWSLDATVLRSAYRSICETSDSRDCGDGFRVVAIARLN